MSADLRAGVAAACDAIEAARDDLCRLDAVAGDGDHGVTMTLGARAVRRALEAHPEADGAALLAFLAPAAGSVGGAIGPLWATLLLRVAGTLRAAGSDPVALTAPLLRACGEAALAGVVALGKATEGDKTIVDALAPAVRALADAETNGDDLATAAQAAAEAARAGAAGTAGMVATLGRAARLGERSRGTADPGATSFALIAEVLASAAAGAA
jgi:phosphoenolpyruvate---glycerone phosphotransferase subunit DhaL